MRTKQKQKAAGFPPVVGEATALNEERQFLFKKKKVTICIEKRCHLNHKLISLRKDSRDKRPCIIYICSCSVVIVYDWVIELKKTMGSRLLFVPTPR